MERLESTGRSAGKIAIFLVPTLILLLDAASIAQGASTKMNKLDNQETGAGGNGGGGGGANSGRPSLTTYDQRQTGKYNIHVNIKDVKIISVDGEKFEGEFGDDTIYDYGDYDYDPAHLTVSPLPIFGGSTTSKPPKATTKTPVSLTSTKRTTTTTESPMEDPPKRPTIDDPVTIDANPIKDDSSSYIMSAPSTTTLPSSNIYIFKPTPNYHPNPVHYDYQEIPVEVIVEPVLKPKYRNSNSRVMANRRNRHRKNSLGGGGSAAGGDMARHGHSDIEALPSEPVINTQLLAATPCARGEFRDKTGKCRMRRAGIQIQAT
ncbi:early growth response protein 1 isoform X2 [Armigeres subalbatus]|uniref:early growth response protein 1 isoform X2 n=1 Tax=Armigeres subalbatus TaxID=124917 RepID=UPI002ED1EB6A